MIFANDLSAVWVRDRNHDATNTHAQATLVAALMLGVLGRLRHTRQ
jgi:hypothetical protein